MLGAVPGAVTAVGTTITSGPANGMPAITSAVAPTGAARRASSPRPGEPLLDSTGHVLGILYDPEPAGSTASANSPRTASSSASSTTSTAPLLTATSYLPTQLVLGVAGDIRAGTNARHGWLGVTGTDQPAGGGAAVAVVDPASPASGRLAPGEVVVEVDGTAGAHHGRAAGPPLRADAGHRRLP